VKNKELRVGLILKRKNKSLIQIYGEYVLVTAVYPRNKYGISWRGLRSNNPNAFSYQIEDQMNEERFDGKRWSIEAEEGEYINDSE